MRKFLFNLSYIDLKMALNCMIWITQILKKNLIKDIWLKS